MFFLLCTTRWSCSNEAVEDADSSVMAVQEGRGGRGKPEWRGPIKEASEAVCEKPMAKGKMGEELGGHRIISPLSLHKGLKWYIVRFPGQAGSQR